VVTISHYHHHPRTAGSRGGSLNDFYAWSLRVVVRRTIDVEVGNKKALAVLHLSHKFHGTYVCLLLIYTFLLILFHTFL
jgi:hypothetical protein